MDPFPSSADSPVQAPVHQPQWVTDTPVRASVCQPEWVTQLKRRLDQAFTLLDVQQAEIDCLYDMLIGYGEFQTDNIRILQDHIEELRARI